MYVPGAATKFRTRLIRSCFGAEASHLMSIFLSSGAGCAPGEPTGNLEATLQQPSGNLNALGWLPPRGRRFIFH